MTRQMRRQRAEILFGYCVLEGKSPGEAWRALHPEADCTEADATRMTLREGRWVVDDLKREQERANSPAAHEDTPLGLKRCAGVANRECSEEIPARRKRCESCAAEQKRVLRQGYNRDYYQAKREELNEKRRERRAVRSKQRKEERQREEQRREKERKREKEQQDLKMLAEKLERFLRRRNRHYL